MPWWLLTLATLDGLSIAWIDSRPGWDDTGVTVGLLVLSAGFWSLFARRRAWAIALAVGAWIPAAALAKGGDVRFLAILIFPAAGAYAGGAIGRVIRGTAAPDAATRA
jgi:hypothetical protein